MSDNARTVAVGDTPIILIERTTIERAIESLLYLLDQVDAPLEDMEDDDPKEDDDPRESNNDREGGEELEI